MTQTTILEKLKIIFEVSKSSKLFIAVIGFIILLAIVALTTNKENLKRGKKIYGFIYIVVIISLIIFYHDSLGKMFDYMMENLFIVIYFPNIAVYLAAIIITNIILWMSVFNLKTPKLIRNINTFVYGIIHYLLALVLNVITKNSLDIFSQISVYGNQEAHAIIEFSSAIFMVWIIFLIIYKLIKKYLIQEKVPVKKKVVVKKIRTLPDTINEVPVPLFVKAQPKKNEDAKILSEERAIINKLTEEHIIEKQELERQLQIAHEQLKSAEQQIRTQEETIKVQDEQRIKLEETNFSLEEEQIKLQYEQTQLQQEANKLQQEKAKLLQETKKLQDEKVDDPNVIKQQKIDATTAIMNNLDGMLTLEDYKVLATILKDKQKRKQNQTTRNNNRDEELLKFSQLQEVYKSIR